MAEGMKVNVQGCARCNSPNHLNLVFTKLANPVRLPGKLLATHWAPCPVNGEPILLMVQQTESM